MSWVSTYGEDLEPRHICGTCKHFRSADIAEEHEEFEDLGVCSALLPCEPSSPFARELVVLYDDTPPDYGTGSCWEGV